MKKYKNCNNKIPQKLKNKVCIKEGAGGKKDVMKNYLINNKTVACAKLYDKKEFIFYKTIQKLKKTNIKHFKILYKYIPKSYNIICEDDNKKYFVIENLIPSVNAKFMDLKLGYKTAMRKEAGLVKYTRHRVLDKVFTVSDKYGFRLEGSNFPIFKNFKTPIQLPTLPLRSRTRSRSKYRMQLLRPLEFFTAFFTNKNDIKSVIQQLYDLIRNFCIPNLETIKLIDDMDYNDKMILKNDLNIVGIGLIGVSLFIYKIGNKRPEIKLIDFAHPTYVTVNSSEKEISLGLEEAVNFTEGLDNILNILKSMVS